MENKYFTPSIEDIRVGYECEIYSEFQNRGFEWTRLLLIPNSVNSIMKDKNKIDRIRVPYLTKEQIEAEGWTLLSSTTYGGWMGSSFQKDNYSLAVNFLNEIPFMSMVFRDPSLAEYPFTEKWRLDIPCKDINTFRYICKLLGI